MSNPQPETVSAAKPKRSTAERVIVQGGIAVLLVLVTIEGWAYLQMSMAHSKLTAELKKAEAGDHKVTRETVDQILGGRAPDDTKTRKAIATGDERYDIYYFKGLLKRRELCVHYGVQGKKGAEGVVSEPEVVEVTTMIPDEILAL